MQNNQAIFESILKRNFSDPGNKEFLEQITSAHPYFSPAQFYLLQQTKEDSEAFKTVAARTSLLFNNPYWLNFQLQQTKEVTVVEPVHSAPLEEVSFEKESVVELEQPAPVDIPKQEEVVLEKEVAAVKEEVYEELNPVVELWQTAPFDTPKEVILENEVPPVKEEVQTEPGPVSVPDQLADVDETGTEEMEKEIEPMKIEMKMPAEKNTMDEMPLFEPMHMVDYFASQGIKLSEEVQSSDKLGKQLKSFTEWLKTMKKVHVENQGQAAVSTDTAIQSLAEKSNTENEVLTVAMADVFAKQGKLEKAREVLEKLSLLNPAKSAYFAAKIESLKEL